MILDLPYPGIMLRKLHVTGGTTMSLPRCPTNDFLPTNDYKEVLLLPGSEHLY